MAIIVALLRILQHDADAIVAFFPSDHFFADDAAFAATVQSAIGAARKHFESLILIGAKPRWPEVEYGCIELGASVTNGGRTLLLRVSRFKYVLSLKPHRLLVASDTTSGWNDLGATDRVIDTLVQNQIEPEWLREWMIVEVKLSFNTISIFPPLILNCRHRTPRAGQTFTPRSAHRPRLSITGFRLAPASVSS